MPRHLGLLALLLLAGAATATPGQTPCSYRWDPAFGAPGLAGSGLVAINAFEAWPATGEFFATGRFSSIGGVPANNIARWNGTTWAPLGTGLNAPGRAFALYDDGHGTALYVGGSFSTAGGLTVNGIARWNGSAWSPVGAGMNSVVEDLEVFDDGLGPALFVTGWFTTAGVVSTNFVARWNASGWSAVGTGLGGVSGNYGRTLCIHVDGSGAALYIGGDFAYPYPNLVRWSGAGFTPVGNMPAPVESLLVHDDGTGPALHASLQTFWAVDPVRRWNGSSWIGLPGLIGGWGTLHAFDGGNGPRLLVGGPTVVLPPSANAHLAQWDGATWSAFGNGGASDTVLALGTYDDGTGTALYAGGYFTGLGGTPANRIGRWWNPVPRFLLLQPGGAGAGVFLFNNHLLAGRTYQNVISLEPCPAGAGAGPWLGLCATDPSFLFSQVLLPLGAVPFHFSASGSTTSFGPYGLPAGLTLDGLCFDRTGGVIGCVSPVQRFTVQ